MVRKEEARKEVQLFEDCLTFKQMSTLLLFGTETAKGTSSAETMAPLPPVEQAGLSGGAAARLYSR